MNMPMSLFRRLKPFHLPGVVVVAAVVGIVVWMVLAGSGEDLPAPGTSEVPVAARLSPGGATRSTKADQGHHRRPELSARDESFRERLEMSRKVDAVVAAARRQMATHRERYPYTTDDPAARAEFEKLVAVTTDPEERDALTRKFLEAGDDRRRAAEAARRTPEALRREQRLQVLSGLSSFLDLPAYVSEGTEFSAEAETLLVKIADFSERSAEMNDEAVIAEFSALDNAIKNLRRRRTEKMPSLLDHEDD